MHQGHAPEATTLAPCRHVKEEELPEVAFSKRVRRPRRRGAQRRHKKVNLSEQWVSQALLEETGPVDLLLGPDDVAVPDGPAGIVGQANLEESNTDDYGTADDTEMSEEIHDPKKIPAGAHQTDSIIDISGPSLREAVMGKFVGSEATDDVDMGPAQEGKKTYADTVRAAAGDDVGVLPSMKPMHMPGSGRAWSAPATPSRKNSSAEEPGATQPTDTVEGGEQSQELPLGEETDAFQKKEGRKDPRPWNAVTQVKVSRAVVRRTAQQLGVL